MHRRSRPFAAWLGIVAMLAQLWIPSWHAAAYAQENDNPLAYAWCGTGAAKTADRLRQQLAPEIVAALSEQSQTLQLTDCALCVVAHAVGASDDATDVPTVFAPPLAASTVQPSFDLPASQALRPPLRGPPDLLA